MLVAIHIMAQCHCAVFGGIMHTQYSMLHGGILAAEKASNYDFIRSKGVGSFIFREVIAPLDLQTI